MNGNDTAFFVTTKLVGTSYHGRQENIKKLKNFELVLLVREPNNPFDINAIKVQRLDGSELGYINRGLAETLSNNIPQWEHGITAKVEGLHQISLMNGKSYCEVEISICG